jgi:redox-sensitive bicupin YhaK (pirin superfamily)
MVGPFVFLDQMGPELLRDGSGLDVAPHPHIGLATVTYLFEGELVHRDSLGVVQPIRPGELNWMTAGRGIVHSERTPLELRTGGSRLFGIQTWVALPARDEEVEPSFAHHGAGRLPEVEGEGNRVRVLVGALFGARSPVATLSETFYADARMDSGATLPVPTDHEERAAYVVDGSVGLAGDDVRFGEGQLLVLEPGEPVALEADGPSRIMLLGGAAMDGPRHIFWNFVSSSRERIEQAKRDWREGRFAPVPGETERIPLPDTGPAVVRYP